MVMKGWLAKLSLGLAKTRSRLADGLRDLFRAGRKIDAEFLEQLEETLILADIGVAATTRILNDLKARYRDREIQPGDDLVAILKTDLKETLGDADREVHFAPAGPTVVLVAGVNGSGKTTAVARLAHLFLAQDKKVLLACCDTFRAAADEQLAIWATRVGVEMIRHQPGADPGAVAFDAAEAAVARGIDVLVVDTAGRLHTQDHLMRELGKIRRVLEKKIPGAPHEVLLVLDATTARTPSPRPRSSAPPSTSRACSSRNSTGPPRAASSWKSNGNWGFRSSSWASAKRRTTSPRSTRTLSSRRSSAPARAETRVPRGFRTGRPLTLAARRSTKEGREGTCRVQNTKATKDEERRSHGQGQSGRREGR